MTCYAKTTYSGCIFLDSVSAQSLPKCACGKGLGCTMRWYKPIVVSCPDTSLTKVGSGHETKLLDFFVSKWTVLGVSHVAAILFKVESAVRNGYTAGTSSACRWNEVFSTKVQQNKGDWVVCYSSIIVCFYVSSIDQHLLLRSTFHNQRGRKTVTPVQPRYRKNHRPAGSLLQHLRSRRCS